MGKIGWKQCIKSILFTAIAVSPALYWYSKMGATQAIVITCFTGFIGFGLSLPGVSAKRVAGGTAAMIIAKNAPRSMQDGIWDALVSEPETNTEEDQTKNAA